MLRQRLVTGTISVLLAVGAVLWLPTAYFALVIGILALISAWEWTALLRFPSLLVRIIYLIFIALCLWAALHHLPVLAVMTAACLWWLIALVWVLRFPKGRSIWANKWVGALAGVWILVPTWLALVSLHVNGAAGPYAVLFLLAMTWIADTAAYFSGRRWGSVKLAPEISPGKTWEGVGGAVLAIIVYAAVGSGLLFSGKMPVIFILLCLVTLFFSVLGDLLESMFKRQAGVKDSGTLFPGHGGLLDRIDSLTAAAPVFMLGLIVSGIMP